MVKPSVVSIAKKEVRSLYKFQYAICTLVTDLDEYSRMLDSFIAAGFTPDDCEYRYIDNTNGNTFDAYQGINQFLQNADARYIVICHQDILLKFDKREQLGERISELDKADKNWAVLGNAGANNLYLASMKVTHADMVCDKKGILPSKVGSLDENFILIKKSANIALSGDLAGFHLYGTDICLIAECLGYTAYVIEFNLIHLSNGKMDPSFYSLSKKVQRKYSSFFRSRYIKTTITRFYLSSSSILRCIMNISLVQNMVRLYYKYEYKLFKKY
ncbi:MAG: putative transrane protein of unknown function [Mucilaginibacter sp.]|nr:putative transrane protein of unknown function [Mucilaginibacter sp.]